MADSFSDFDLGYFLKSGREDCDLSQKKVMELTGINNKTLSGYENNISEPDFITLITLLKLYNLSLDDLIFSENERKNTDIKYGGKYKMIDELPPDVRDDIMLQVKVLHKKYCK